MLYSHRLSTERSHKRVFVSAPKTAVIATLIWGNLTCLHEIMAALELVECWQALCEYWLSRPVGNGGCSGAQQTLPITLIEGQMLHCTTSKNVSLRNFGNSVYPPLPVSFGWDTKSRWSLQSGVYARGSKRTHQSARECVTVADSTLTPPQKCIYAAEKAALHW